MIMLDRMCRMPAQLFELGNKGNGGPVASYEGLAELVTWQLAMHMEPGVMQASDTLDDRSERSGCGDPGPLPPPIDTWHEVSRLWSRTGTALRRCQCS